MIAVFRQLLFLAIAGVTSWWFLLRVPLEEQDVPTPSEAPAQLSVRTKIETPEPRASHPQAPPEPQAQQPARQTASVPGGASPPPPELGAPEGKPDPQAAPAPEDLAREVQAEEAPLPESSGTPVDELRKDPKLLDEARREFEGEVRRGFSTVLLAAPEDQLDLARTFGEELVLVPRTALDPNATNPTYFRLRLTGPPSVERVQQAPPLESYRQYRDLFDYEYSRLPEPLRELRRSVLSRDEVYLFAALIPVSEWAVVLGRRQEALDQLGTGSESVRRFTLRYVRTGSGGFDLRVEHVELADGSTQRMSANPVN